MKLAPLILAGGALSIACLCLADPLPLLPDESGSTSDAAPETGIAAGGACEYKTAEIKAVVADVTESGAIMSQSEGRGFSFSAEAFQVTGQKPAIGQAYTVSKRVITKGTCVPVMYELLGPAGPDLAVPTSEH